MKRLLLCLLLLPAFLQAAENTVTEITTTPKVGKLTWILRETGFRWKATDPWKPEELIYTFADGPKNTLDRPKPPTVPKELKMKRTDAEAFVGFLNKFNEWSKVARANGVKVHTKELGQLTGSGDAVDFVVAAGVPTMHVKNWGGPFVITEADAADILSLLAKLPELDAAIGTTKPKDATDALFK
jgi:hypothetical protein